MLQRTLHGLGRRGTLTAGKIRAACTRAPSQLVCSWNGKASVSCRCASSRSLPKQVQEAQVWPNFANLVTCNCYQDSIAALQCCQLFESCNAHATPSVASNLQSVSPLRVAILNVAHSKTVMCATPCWAPALPGHCTNACNIRIPCRSASTRSCPDFTLHRLAL